MASPATLVADASEAILDCVVASLDESPAQSPARAYISVGEPAWDDCCDGQVAVWWSLVYPSSTFPDSDTRPVQCPSPITAIEFQVEIVRCAPGPDQNGVGPSVEALMESARLTDLDARAVWLGVMCCLRTHKEHPDNWSSIVAGQVPVGPEGGCVGSRLTFTVGVIDGCGCT